MFPRDPLTVLIPLVALLVGLTPVTGEESTLVGVKALQEYVNRADPAYGWKVVGKRKTRAGTAYVIETSHRLATTVCRLMSRPVSRTAHTSSV